MSDTKKNKGGRPQKYPGEEPVRIGALIRPRYKQVLELVSRDRNCTLGEAIEFSLSKLASEYLIDRKPIIDYVRPAYEPKKRIYEALNLNYLLSMSDEEKKIVDENYKNAKWELMNAPRYIKSSLTNYLAEVFRFNLEKTYKIFDLDLLFAAIEENWKEAISTEESMNDIYIVSNFCHQKILPKAKSNSDIPKFENIWSNLLISD